MATNTTSADPTSHGSDRTVRLSGWHRAVLRWKAASRLGLLCAALGTALSGCALRDQIAVDALVPILDATMVAAYGDQDVQTVREGIAANLLLLRGVAEAHPENRRMHEVAAQTYFSFGMGFIEDADPQRAELLYAEGLRLGRRGLAGREWFARAESEQPLPSEATLQDIDEEDVPILFWTLANWIRWISLNLGEPEAVAELPRTEAYLQRVLELEPEFYFGMPYAMLGALQAFRPRMLGGDPEAGRINLEKAIEISGNRMLIFQVLYAQFYCRQMLDEECFTETLLGVIDAPIDLLPEYQLWNEVARRKAVNLLEMKDELF